LARRPRPEALVFTLEKHAPGLVRAALETGALSAFLYHGLTLRGLPVACICARHAMGVLRARNNKSDAHDALGLAHLARTGWLEQVHIKDSATHLDRTRLEVREQLIHAHGAIANQLRGLMKLFGRRLGKATTSARRAERLAALPGQQPALRPVLAPLVTALAALEEQIRVSSPGLKAKAEADPVAARLMSVPGIGRITALAFKSSIEDPFRFARSADAGAYAGLVPKRFQ
jgi:transposase